MQEITQDLVQSLFEYKDGELYWKKLTSNLSRVKIGDCVGGLHKHTGYHNIKLNTKLYLTHRLIFLYHHGYLPKYIDHIDGDKNNNNINNLREVTQSQNSMNRKSHNNTSSQYKGVCWNKLANKWKSYITINGKTIHLGYFTDESNAAKVYNDAAIEYHKEYARLNKLGE